MWTLTSLIPMTFSEYAVTLEYAVHVEAIVSWITQSQRFEVLMRLTTVVHVRHLLEPWNSSFHFIDDRRQITTEIDSRVELQARVFDWQLAVLYIHDPIRQADDAGEGRGRGIAQEVFRQRPSRYATCAEDQSHIVLHADM